jgi:hypothetical protein
MRLTPKFPSDITSLIANEPFDKHECTLSLKSGCPSQVIIRVESSTHY